MNENNPRPVRILVATTNAGKLKEFSQLLAPLGLPLLSLSDVGGTSAPDETGSTYRENAAIKAASYARQTSEWVIADDSGLEIRHLGGAPGIHSARFAGSSSNYADKMQSILDVLDGIEPQHRDARFVSVIALADPTGKITLSAEGICEGTIGLEPRGVRGFGYDPIFLPRGFDRSFGEMSEEEKRALSHRGRASEVFIGQMLDFMGL